MHACTVSPRCCTPSLLLPSSESIRFRLLSHPFLFSLHLLPFVPPPSLFVPLPTLSVWPAGSFLPSSVERFASPLTARTKKKTKKKKRKVCWFVRWPVVSTPLHMVTYHQSTPATRFAPRALWIFMDRK